MATFYVLPPRACLEQVLGGVVGQLLPGLPVPADGWNLLLLHLAAASGWSKDLYLVSRDELPDGEPVADALRGHFGAEPGDRVVEVSVPRGGAAGPVRAWTVGPGAVSAAAGGSYNYLVAEFLLPAPAVSGVG